ncbi:MAG: bifunctional folylpolyglutamate synthase/dihydrofolate synthase [Lachnospiraceae bacterium]|nr:bifunctional folylpolyglutamate synthase/dihydrofolate synthase [Lachnospiraceae bacterium]
MADYTYEAAVEFFHQMPHFVPPKEGGAKKDYFTLDAEMALLEALDHPEQKLRFVHVAGTNGKGSTCAYLANMLKESGYKTGSFTSPYLYRYNEMMRINGEDISDEEFGRVFTRVKKAYDQVLARGFSPSEYEILTVMGFVYFLQQGCDLVVLEVSLGGRTDTTNVIPAPQVAVIAPISYDHTSILGNTLTEIATEKAGIIKQGTVVVTAPQEAEVMEVLEQTTAAKQVLLHVAPVPTLIQRDLRGQRFEYEGEDYVTGLLGVYQIGNAAVALRAVDVLRQRGYEISIEAAKRGIATTTWFGRFSLLQSHPTILVDGGHNPQGAKVLRQSLEAYFPGKKITYVLGVLGDKDVDAMLDQLLPIAERVLTLTVPNPRALGAKELANRIRLYGIEATEVSDVGDAMSRIRREEVVCIAGSLYLLSQVNRKDDSDKRN